jgi:hypothetical protein
LLKSNTNICSPPLDLKTSTQSLSTKQMAENNELNTKETSNIINCKSSTGKSLTYIPEIKKCSTSKNDEINIQEENLENNKNFNKTKQQDSIIDNKKIINYKIFNSRRKESSVLSIAKLWDKRGDSKENLIHNNK